MVVPSLSFSTAPNPLAFKLRVSSACYWVLSLRVSARGFLTSVAVLCGEGRIKTQQREPYGEMKIFLNEHYNPFGQIVADVQSKAMESDDDRF